MDFRTILKRYGWIGAVVVAAIAIGVAIYLAIRPAPADPSPSSAASATATSTPAPGAVERPRVVMTANDDTARGIGTDTSFRLTLPKGISVEKLASAIRTRPKIAFRLEAGASGGEAVLVPEVPLAQGQVYRFTLEDEETGLDESFAFQTRRAFRVVSTLPADRSTRVPVNTGVEIRFSDPGFEGMESRFEMVPVVGDVLGDAVEGRWEVHRDTASFVPSTDLAPGLLYQVTLKAGVRQADSDQETTTDTVFSFQTQLAAEPVQDAYLDLADTVRNATTAQVPVFSLICDAATLETDWSVTVWRYPDSGAFRRDVVRELAIPYWTERTGDRMPSTDGLEQVAAFTARPQTEDYTTLLAFPQNMGEGHYLVRCETGALTDFAFLQVNDLLLYLSVSESNTLAWAHDAVGGGTLPGVAIKSDTGIAGQTGEDGIALLEGRTYKDPTQAPCLMEATRAGHPAFIAVLASPLSAGDYSWYKLDDPSRSNWHYLYTERGTYLPTDAVHFWGVLRPRDGGAPPAHLTVSLTNNEYWTKDGIGGMTLDVATVPVGPRGTYEGGFTFEGLESGGYNLVVRDGDTEVDRTWIYIEPYVKPAYTIGATLDGKVLFPGESLQAEMTGRFFEGTPVPGVALDTMAICGGQELYAGSTALDGTGRSTVRVQVPEFLEAISWRPLFGSFQASAQETEEAEISVYQPFVVFPRDTMTWLDATLEKGQLTADLHVHRIEAAAARTADDAAYWGDPATAPYAGAAADTPVEAVVFEHYWDRKVVGKGYDYINKLSYDKYEYFEVDRQVAEFTFTPVNGVAHQSLVVPGWRDDASYRIEYALVDGKGRAIRETEYLGMWWSWYGTGYGDQYELRSPDTGTGCRVGEDIRLELTRNGNPLTPEDGAKVSVLYLLARDGHVAWSAENAGTKAFPFLEKYVPNLYAQAVVFDGKSLYETQSQMISYDSSEKRLRVAVSTDAEAYRPGEKVRLDVAVTDPDGKPVQAAVNLSVVDEAYFAMYPQTVDPLGSLYMPVFWSGILDSYVSHEALSAGGGAEGGEGDDNGTPVRRDFRDTAWFGSVETDADGKAQTAFTMPDNLTTFRVTAQAVTDALQAGAGLGKAVSRLPFFVQLVAPSTCLAGDAPTLLVRAYGSGLTQETTDFEVTLAGESGAERAYAAQGKGQAYVAVSVDALTTGTWKLTVRGKNGPLTDAVERTIRVENRLMTVQRTTAIEVASGKGLGDDAIARGSEGPPSVLVVGNRQYQRMQTALWELYGAWGMRIDQAVARSKAATLLRDVMKDPSVTEVPQFDFSQWQQADGGLALLPYAQSDVMLSARLCSVAPELFDAAALRPWFQTIAKDEKALPMHTAAALWGLASLGDPVLVEVRDLLAGDDLKDDERLVLALALADLGDRAGAADVFAALDARYGKDAAPLHWFDFGPGREDVLELTALAAMLAVRTEQPQADGLFAYLEKNRSREDPYLPEKLAMLQSRVAAVSTSGSATIVVDGVPQAIQVEGAETWRMLLKPGQLAGVRFEAVAGALDALLVSRVGAETLQDGVAQVATVTRSYQVGGKNVDTAAATDAVEVVLTVNFTKDSPQGDYMLTDLLPAGLRFTGGTPSMVGADGNWEDWCWWQADGQQITTALYHKGGARTRVFRYRARASGAGSFSADAPVVRHQESDASGFGTISFLKVLAP